MHNITIVLITSILTCIVALFIMSSEIRKTRLRIINRTEEIYKLKNAFYSSEELNAKLTILLTTGKAPL